MNLTETTNKSKRTVLKSTYGIETFSDQEYNRPRRPNPDTIQYLSSLPLDLNTVDEAFHKVDFNHSGDESQMITAAKAAIEEVQHEIASLAGEERSSEQLELLVKVACGEHLGNCELSARRMLNGLSGYYLHLACHRYGSHVVQKVLDVCGRFQGGMRDSNSRDEAFDNNIGDDNLPSVQTLVSAAAVELIPHARSLAKHACGSHVIRAIVCALSGTAYTNEVIGKCNTSLNSDKRGEKNKRRGGRSVGNRPTQDIKIEFSMTAEGAQGLESMIESITGYTSKKSIAKGGSLKSNLGADAKTLTLLCHPSAGPLIDLLIRVLAALSKKPTVTEGHQHLAKKLFSSDNALSNYMETRIMPTSEAEMFIKYLLHWSNPTKCGDIVFGLSGETYGSRILETIFQVIHDDMYQDLLERANFVNPTSLIDYVHHDVSNFVVQTILQTIRSVQQGQTIAEGLIPLLRNGEILHPSRRGVAFHLVHMCAQWNIEQNKVIEALVDGCSKQTTEETSKKLSVKVNDGFIHHLLLDEFPKDEGGKLKFDFNGLRIIHSLLRFSPHRCKKVIDGILSLKDSEIVAISKDGVASRW